MESIEMVFICAKELYEIYKENPSDSFDGGTFFDIIKDKISHNQNIEITGSLFTGALKYLAEYRSVKFDFFGSHSLFDPNEIPTTIQPRPRIIDFIQREDYKMFLAQEEWCKKFPEDKIINFKKDYP